MTLTDRLEAEIEDKERYRLILIKFKLNQDKVDREIAVLTEALALIKRMEWRPIGEADKAGQYLEVVVQNNADPSKQHIRRSRYYDAGACQKTGQNFGVGFQWEFVDEYTETVIACRDLSALPKLPDTGEGK